MKDKLKDMVITGVAIGAGIALAIGCWLFLPRGPSK